VVDAKELDDATDQAVEEAERHGRKDRRTRPAWSRLRSSKWTLQDYAAGAPEAPAFDGALSWARLRGTTRGDVASDVERRNSPERAKFYALVARSVPAGAREASQHRSTRCPVIASDMSSPALATVSPASSALVGVMPQTGSRSYYQGTVRPI
jgi:hypothetical protein